GDMGIRIGGGEVEHGDALPTEEEVGGELGADLVVSRTVVREAIKVLAAKGLVESRPKTGSRVRPRRDWNLLDPDVLAWQIEAGPDADFLRPALGLRPLVEPAVARLPAAPAPNHRAAAGRAPSERGAALRGARGEWAPAGPPLDPFRPPPPRSHTPLLEACRNDPLEHMSEIFTAVLRTVFAYSSSSSRAYPKAARR